jgi:serine/threonine-protein kinase
MATTVPFGAGERREPTPAPQPRRRAAAAPPRSRPPVPRTNRGLPRWIPVAGIVAVLLVIAGAVAALSNGGDDKGTAAVTPPAKKTTTAKKKSPTTSSQTTPATSSQTTPSSTTPAASGDPAQMQAQAHALINQGNYDQAIALDKQIVAQGPGSGLTYAYALYDLGHALRLAGRPQEAIPVLEQRMKIDNQRDVVQAELDRAKAEAKGKPAPKAKPKPKPKG